MARLFTLAEAKALLPRLNKLLPRMQATALALQRTNEELAELRQLVRLNGHAQQAEQLARDQAHLQAQLRAEFRVIEQMGVELKDMATGLVDFRSNRDGRVVYLCWRLGETDINYWHELDGGVAGRQPL